MAQELCMAGGTEPLQKAGPFGESVHHDEQGSKLGADPEKMQMEFLQKSSS